MYVCMYVSREREEEGEREVLGNAEILYFGRLDLDVLGTR